MSNWIVVSARMAAFNVFPEGGEKRKHHLAALEGEEGNQSEINAEHTGD